MSREKALDLGKEALLMIVVFLSTLLVTMGTRSVLSKRSPCGEAKGACQEVVGHSAR